MKSYSAPAWLPGAHLQTIWPMMIRPRVPMPAFIRERIETPDEDFLDLDWVYAARALRSLGGSVLRNADGGATQSRTPLVVLFHGLEGSSNSLYARALMHETESRGWNGVVVHFRSCSGELNRLPRAYHSGDSAEIEWVLKTLKQRFPKAPIFAVGVSLGGNALLKYLGEQGENAIPNSAATVSVPFCLSVAERCLSRGPAKLYSKYFLKTLIPLSLKKAAQFPDHPGLNCVRSIQSIRTIKEFDNIVTAPLHGFEDADAYYAHSSSGQYLAGISIPTLMLQAKNDPFLTPEALPVEGALPDCVKLEVSATGGHAGFIDGPFPGRVEWMPQRILDEFTLQLAAEQSTRAFVQESTAMIERARARKRRGKLRSA